MKSNTKKKIQNTQNAVDWSQSDGAMTKTAQAPEVTTTTTTRDRQTDRQTDLSRQMECLTYSHNFATCGT